MWETRPCLEGGLPAGFERQGQSQRPSQQDQAPTYIYRDCSCQIRIQCDDWRLEIRRGVSEWVSTRQLEDRRNAWRLGGIETRGVGFYVPKSQRVSSRWQSVHCRFLCLWQGISPVRSRTKLHTLSWQPHHRHQHQRALLAYESMAVLTLLQNAYPQFHPSNPSLLLAVVLPNKKTPVKAERGPVIYAGSLNNAATGRTDTSACLKKSLASHGDQGLGVLRPTQQASIREHPEH